MTTQTANPNRLAPLQTPTTFPANSVRDIAGELTLLLADVFALYIKTKNFHWHMSGPHFRDYHLLLDEQGDQIFAMTDDIAERARKIGGATLRSVGQISRSQRILDNDAEFVTPDDMLAELRDGPVAELVGIEGDVVSGVFNLKSSDVGALERRPRHDERYHEEGGCRRRRFAFR